MVFETYSETAVFDTSFSMFNGFTKTGFLHQPDPEDICGATPSIPANSTDAWFSVIGTYPSCLNDTVGSVKDAGYKLLIVPDRSELNLSEADVRVARNVRGYDFPIVIISKDFVDNLTETALSDFSDPDVLATVKADNNLFIILIILVSTALPVVLLCCFVYCWCVCRVLSRYCNRGTYQQLTDRGWYIQRPLGAERTSRLPIQEYLERSTEEDLCVICREVLRGGEPVKILPCGHRCFHTGCIDKWLIERNNKCPLCRDKIRVRKKSVCSSDRRYDEATDTSDSHNPFVSANERLRKGYKSMSLNT